MAPQGLFGVLLIGVLLLVARLLSSGALREGSGRGGVTALIGLCLLPLGMIALSVSAHLENAKSTEFCLSCHVMEPYGHSLEVEDESFLAAAHFQNRWVPEEKACFTCHTQYTMFGGVQAKLTGVKHLWVNYFGEIPDPIELYQPYRNRECLSCHGGARRFEAEDLHAEIRDELAAEETSCLDCHDPMHAVDEIADLPRWEGLANAGEGP